MPATRRVMGSAAVAAGLLLAGCASVQPATVSRSAAGRLVTPSCAWPVALNAATLRTDDWLNIHNPDTGADYWVMEYTVEDGLRITLKGRFPDSRYMALATYNAHGLPFTVNGVRSTITDYQIAPDPGSVNPWRRRAKPGGAFTVTLRSTVRPGQGNVVPLAPEGTPAGTAGLLFLRVYAPGSANPRSVHLPSVTFWLGRESKLVPACSGPIGASSPVASGVRAVLGLGPAAGGTPGATVTGAGALLAHDPPGGIVPFALGPPAVGTTPDSDTRYLSAVVNPPRNGDVLVVRAKAPTTPGGTAPRPWPAAGVDMRYWSICVDLLAPPTPVVVSRQSSGQESFDCRDDNQVALDRHGYYTMVIGAQSELPLIGRVRGVTFLPWASGHPYQPYKINLRNILPSTRFAEAVQDVAPDANPASAASVMGPYYPRLGFCSLGTLTRSGPGACLVGG